MKQKIHQLVREWDEYLHLPGEAYWKLEGITSPPDFFRHLPTVFSYGSTLLFEGLEIGSSAKTLYSQHPAAYVEKVACDGIAPPPDSYHVEFSEAFAESLCTLIKNQGMTSAFYHFKGYSKSEVSFTFHDAFEAELVVSNAISENAIRRFGDALGCKPELAGFPVNLKQNLIAMDRAMNPPWWKKLMRRSHLPS